MPEATEPNRTALFISHATPEDNHFVRWLGAKLMAMRCEVWADALGAFAHQAIGPGFFSLPVIDSRKVWIVTDAEVQVLLEQAER